MILTATGFLRHEELKKRRIEAKILRHHSTVCQAVMAGGGGFFAFDASHRLS
jgi:shikimate kinase